MTARYKILPSSLLHVKPFPDSRVTNMDKSNCMVFLIGHHPYLSSPSLTQRTLPSTGLWPSIISHMWDYRGFNEQLPPSYPIMSSRASLLSTGEVRCPPLPLTAHHNVTGERKEGIRAVVPRKPGVHRCNCLPTWQIACFICKGGKKRGAPWDLRALQQASTACGHRAGKPGPSKGPCGGANQ